MRTHIRQHRQFSTLVVTLLIAVVLPGCITTGQRARYVYQDGEFGVVGIPENTNRWPQRYQDQADALMDRHFPEGYEIVRAEEVEEGSRTLEIKGTGTAEITPAVPADILSLAKIGRTSSRSQSDQLKIREARIVYRRAARPVALSVAGSTDGDEPPLSGPELSRFASQATLSPDPYIDPNAPGRLATAKAIQEATTELAALKSRTASAVPNPVAADESAKPDSNPTPKVDGETKIVATPAPAPSDTSKADSEARLASAPRPSPEPTATPKPSP